MTCIFLNHDLHLFGRGLQFLADDLHFFRCVSVFGRWLAFIWSMTRIFSSIACNFMSMIWIFWSMILIFLVDDMHLFDRWLAFFHRWLAIFVDDLNFLANNRHFFNIDLHLFGRWWYSSFWSMTCMYLIDDLHVFDRWLAVFVEDLNFLVNNIHFFER